MRAFYLVVMSAALIAPPAAAQQTAQQAPMVPQVPPAPPDTAFANLNFGFQSQSQGFGQRAEFGQYDETVSFESQHAIKGAPSFEIGGGARVWRDLSIGISYHRRSKHTRDVSVTAQVPSPIFSDTLRSATSTLSGLEHREDAIHVQALWNVPVTVEFDVTVFGGPTFFRVKDDLVENIGITEVGGDFSTVNLAAATSRQRNNATGYHLGLDTSYMFIRSGAPSFLRKAGLGFNAGVGAVLRYSHGSVDLQLPPNSVGQPVKIDTGGLEIAAGLRFRF